MNFRALGLLLFHDAWIEEWSLWEHWRLNRSFGTSIVNWALGAMMCGLLLVSGGCGTTGPEEPTLTVRLTVRSGEPYVLFLSESGEGDWFLVRETTGFGGQVVTADWIVRFEESGAEFDVAFNRIVRDRDRKTIKFRAEVEDLVLHYDANLDDPDGKG